MANVVYVALGGAVGAVGRYLVSLLPAKTVFPIGTLAVNFAGALLIGAVVGVAEDNPALPPGALLFWKTGVCGGFTTFSTFSLEAVQLVEQGHAALGVCYVALSVALCLLGVVLGRAAVLAVRS